MILEFTRSGGFGGTQLKATVDTDKILDTEAAKLKSMVASLPTIAPPGIGQDRFSYRLRVINNGSEMNYTFSEHGHQDLIKYMTNRAKQPA